MRPTVRVLGVGSPHGDDQVGWRLVECLAGGSAPAVDAIALGDPVDLLGHLDGCDMLIVLDACRAGLPPGRLIRLPWQAVRSGERAERTTHGFGVSAALALADALGRLPPTVLLIGIEAESCEPGTGLSPTLRQAIPGIVPRIEAIIAGAPDLGASPPWDWAISVHDHARRAGVGSDARTVDGPGPADAGGGTDAGASGRSGGGHPRRRGPVVGGRSRPLPERYSDLAAASCARGAEHHITPIPLELQCPQCRTRFLPAKFRFVCPSCGSDRVVVLRGEGLILQRVTLEETEPQSHP